MPSDHDSATDYEEQHVHSVYEKIASHFSSTRYKPWPIIERFLQSRAPGSIGLDIGCGNGKYLAVNQDIFIIASDRSSNLVEIAKTHQRHEVLVADILNLPHHQGLLDFVICIAVVHHLSTPERRIEAIRSILEPLRPDGQALVFVWALEQGGSRRGWTEQDEQDVMVPWVTRGSKKAAATSVGDEKTVEPFEDRVVHRYYHLYREGELNRDVHAAGGVVVDSGYEKDNWWAIATREST